MESVEPVEPFPTLFINVHYLPLCKPHSIDINLNYLTKTRCYIGIVCCVEKGSTGSTLHTYVGFTNRLSGRFPNRWIYRLGFM